MAKVTKLGKREAPIQVDQTSKSQNSEKIRAGRCVETMFRTSYRAQLDMIALAATKANIMISLNGVLVSVLLVSGAYFLASDPLLLIPVTVFLITCTTAITFAVLAARPDVDKRERTLEEFRTDQAELLIYDQFTHLSAEEFTSTILEMIQSNERVYGNMATHVHSLGCIAQKKFARLYISYNSFIIGLIASVASLIAVIVYHAVTNV